MKIDIFISIVWPQKARDPNASVGPSLRFKSEQSLPSGYSQDRGNLLILAIDEMFIKGLFPKVWEEFRDAKRDETVPQV